jgi:hypothetical protein
MANLPENFRTATSIARHFGKEIEKAIQELGAEPFRTDDTEIYWDWDAPEGGLFWELRICDSEENDGSDEGFAFSLSSCYEGGEIGPGFCYGNFSDDLWTRDAQELSARLGYTLDAVANYWEDTYN